MVRNLARYLAPVALAATIAGGYLIVHHNLNARSNPAAHATRGSAGRNRSRAKGKYARLRFITVQPGQTLTAISALTGIALGTLESLNPSLNPNALQAGQRIRLRR
jgi:predicted Zn-dependent protease